MPSSESETCELLQRAHAGDGDAVSRLLQKYRTRLRQMVTARMDPRLSARVDPSDVIQEAMVIATEQLPGYLHDRPIPFYPWLRRIAWQQLVRAHERHRDAAKRSIRREGQHAWGISDHSAVQLGNLLDGNFSSPSHRFAREEDQRRLQEALSRLSELDREVVLLRYVEGLSVPEIAAGLGATDAAIYKRQARALEKLHQLLHRDINHDT